MSPAAAKLSSGERDAIRQASQWYVRLTGEAASERERRAWQQWLAADPQHLRAWQRIEAVQQRVGQVPGQLAAGTLNSAAQSRRQLLRSVVLLVSVGGVAALGWRSEPRQRLSADYRTAVGERRSITLADGSQLLLNTSTVLDMRFDAQQRLLVLLAGEVLVTTAPDPAGRPFRVATAHGQVRALGTRFTVFSDDTGSQVAVLEKAVEVNTPGHAPVRLEAGQRTRFDARGVQPVFANDAAVGAWARGRLISLDRPLGDLLTELGRYRSGWLNCDPSIAGLKVSGAFSLDDTDQALAALEQTFPVRMVRRTRYWVTVVPRG